MEFSLAHDLSAADAAFSRQANAGQRDRAIADRPSSRRKSSSMPRLGALENVPSQGISDSAFAR
jgi:hypothetical protein